MGYDILKGIEKQESKRETSKISRSHSKVKKSDVEQQLKMLLNSEEEFQSFFDALAARNSESDESQDPNYEYIYEYTVQ